MTFARWQSHRVKVGRLNGIGASKSRFGGSGGEHLVCFAPNSDVATTFLLYLEQTFFLLSAAYRI